MGLNLLRNEERSLSNTMSKPVIYPAGTLTRLIAFVVGLCAFSLSLLGSVSPARGQSLSEIEARIKTLQQQQKDIKATQAYLDDALKNLKNGEYVYASIADG